MEITISDAIITQKPKCPNWSKSNNGGDYAFGVREVFADNKKIGALQWYSGESDRCQITGQFTKTMGVILEGGHTIRVASHEALYFERDEDDDPILSIEEFKKLCASYSE